MQVDADNAILKWNDLRFYLVGRFLSDKPINFLAMKSTLASVWEPGKGITFTEVEGADFCFNFFMK